MTFIKLTYFDVRVDFSHFAALLSRDNHSPHIQLLRPLFLAPILHGVSRCIFIFDCGNSHFLDGPRRN